MAEPTFWDNLRAAEESVRTATTMVNLCRERIVRLNSDERRNSGNWAQWEWERDFRAETDNLDKWEKKLVSRINALNALGKRTDGWKNVPIPAYLAERTNQDIPCQRGNSGNTDNRDNKR